VEGVDVLRGDGGLKLVQTKGSEKIGKWKER